MDNEDSAHQAVRFQDAQAMRLNVDENMRHLQGKVKKVEEKISDPVAEFKHSERLAAAKIPTKWHMPSRIERDMGKGRTKLDESQAELHRLELQASHTQHSFDHGPGSEGEMCDEEGSNILDVGNLSLGEDSGEEVE